MWVIRRPVVSFVAGREPPLLGGVERNGRGGVWIQRRPVIDAAGTIPPNTGGVKELKQGGGRLHAAPFLTLQVRAGRGAE